MVVKPLSQKYENSQENVRSGDIFQSDQIHTTMQNIFSMQAPL